MQSPLFNQTFEKTPFRGILRLLDTLSPSLISFLYIHHQVGPLSNPCPHYSCRLCAASDVITDTYGQNGALQAKQHTKRHSIQRQQKSRQQIADTDRLLQHKPHKSMPQE